jgi:seryl-tRNA synthetase
MKVTIQFLLIALCGVGIYFSLKAKDQFQGQADAVTAQIAANAKLDTAIKKAVGELGVEMKGLSDANDSYVAVEAELVSANTKQRDNNREITDNEAQLSEQAAQLEKQDNLLKETKTAVAKALGKSPDEISVDTIAGDIENLNKTEKDLKAKMEELNQLVSTAESNVARNKMNIADLSSRKERRDERIAANAQEAVISDVDTDWGICVINAGKNMGFTPQTRLLVLRGKTLIGSINPESISANETVAKININSFAPGVSPQAGDRVLLEKPITD